MMNQNCSKYNSILTTKIKTEKNSVRRRKSFAPKRSKYTCISDLFRMKKKTRLKSISKSTHFDFIKKLKELKFQTVKSLSKEFKILKTLGSGSNSIVKLIQHVDTNDQFVAKIINLKELLKKKDISGLKVNSPKFKITERTKLQICIN
jgi:hypothetical protein